MSISLDCTSAWISTFLFWEPHKQRTNRWSQEQSSYNLKASWKISVCFRISLTTELGSNSEFPCFAFLDKRLKDVFVLWNVSSLWQRLCHWKTGLLQLKKQKQKHDFESRAFAWGLRFLTNFFSAGRGRVFTCQGERSAVCGEGPLGYGVFCPWP